MEGGREAEHHTLVIRGSSIQRKQVRETNFWAGLGEEAKAQ